MYVSDPYWHFTLKIYFKDFFLLWIVKSTRKNVFLNLALSKKHVFFTSISLKILRLQKSSNETLFLTSSPNIRLIWMARPLWHQLVWWRKKRTLVSRISSMRVLPKRTQNASKIVNVFITDVRFLHFHHGNWKWEKSRWNLFRSLQIYLKNCFLNKYII